MSHVLAYAATAQIRSHSSPFSLLFYRLFDITRIHNAHCLHTRNFPLFHVFSLLLFSSPSCFCFLQFPFFPPFFPLLRIISAALSLRGTRFSLSLSPRIAFLFAASREPRFFFFFFSLRLNFPLPYSPSLAAISPPFVPTFSFFIYSSHVPPPCLSSRFLFVASNPSSPRPDPTYASRARASERKRIQSERSQRARGCWPRARCTFCRERSSPLPGSPITHV